MKNVLALVGIVLIIILSAAFIFGNLKFTNSNLDSKGKFQIVKLSVINGKYVMDPSELKKGVTVRLEADMLNMPGCAKSIVIPAFDVRKSFISANNTVEFTPDKAGTFNIACSMNMYGGTFVVLDN